MRPVGRSSCGAYSKVRAPGHHRADTRGYVMEHVLVAERALGRQLCPPHVVHHVNGDAHDNRPANLVVCEDQAYHLLLHMRQRALQAGAPGDWRLCRICGEYDAAERLYIGDRNNVYHRACNAARMMRSYRARKATAQSNEVPA